MNETTLCHFPRNGRKGFGCCSNISGCQPASSLKGRASRCAVCCAGGLTRWPSFPICRATCLLCPVDTWAVTPDCQRRALRSCDVYNEILIKLFNPGCLLLLLPLHTFPTSSSSLSSSFPSSSLSLNCGKIYRT